MNAPLMPTTDLPTALSGLLAFAVPEVIQRHGDWLIPTVLVAIAALIGFRDVIRFSPVRVYAIAGVCFRESIRRKVLLVIPLAILGVLVVSRFQLPTDELDAVRQTLKFCLFATGLIAVLTLIILSCTNLPREIDNRVIYTIVTKPTTRLEIVLGKVVGFGCVSLTVLGIMGVFTYGFINYRAWSYQRDISEKLHVLAELEKANSPAFDPAQLASLQHYQEFGLLTAKRLNAANKVSVVSSVPSPNDTIKWAPYGMVGEVLVPVRIDRSKLDPILSAPENATNVPKLVVEVTASHRDIPDFRPIDPASRPFLSPFVDPDSDGRRSSLRISVFSRYAEAMLDSSQIQGMNKELAEKGETTVRVEIPRLHVPTVASEPQVYIQIAGEDGGREYGFGNQVVRMFVEYPDGRRDDFVVPNDERMDPSRQLAIFRGRSGRGGQQITGANDGTATVGFYQFRNVPVGTGNEPVGIEVHVAVERSTWDAEQDDVQTEMELTVFNRSADAGQPVTVTGYPENNRTLFLTVPASAVRGGNFDIALRCKTAGHFITANGDDVVLISERQPFMVNLVKSLFVMWMMSMLIIIISVFTSTFLSWPIAVVLTLVLLTGRWAVNQLGDSLGSGMGNQIATNMGLQDPAMSRVVSQSVDGLTNLLKGIAQILPDISAFAAVEDIERGLLVPMQVILGSGQVLLIFGLPLLALAYVFLRYKEVAP